MLHLGPLFYLGPVVTFVPSTHLIVTLTPCYNILIIIINNIVIIIIIIIIITIIIVIVTIILAVT